MEMETGRSRGAYTLMDTLVTLAVVVILIGLFLPILGRARDARRQQCLRNLQQLQTALDSWGNDHDRLYPWQTPQARGGTLEHVGGTNLNHHLRVLRAELDSATHLKCPADPSTLAAKDWDSLTNSNISYFVSISAQRGRKKTLLAGDRSLRNSGAAIRGWTTLRQAESVDWSPTLHRESGNLLWADGEAGNVSSLNLQRQLEARGTLPAMLLFP